MIDKGLRVSGTAGDGGRNPFEAVEFRISYCHPPKFSKIFKQHVETGFAD